MCSSRSVSPAWTTPSTNSWISTPTSPGKTLLPASFSSASVSSTRSTLHFGPMAKPVGEKLIVDNRRARHDYHLLDRVEAGLVLTGTEVKSLRDGRASLQQAYADVRGDEAWLVGAHISVYEQGNRENHDPDRDRKLLLRRHEIDSLAGKVRERGLTLVPTKLYFRNGRAKVELALARGKEQRDKRRDLAKREAQRDMERALKSRR